MKRTKLALLAAGLLLLAGCNPGTGLTDQQFDIAGQRQEAPAPEQPEKPPAQAVSEIRLAYSASDSLNPYTMKTQLNRELVPLLYDSLTRPDKSFRPENLLAEEVTVEGTTCTIKYRTYAQFSDGTLLTGRDIVYSIRTAQNADSNWSALVRNIASATAGEDGTVVLRLFTPDADFAALLTFPIVKEGTAGADFPTGVSQYYVGGTWENGVRLTANPLYWRETGAIESIRLVQSNNPDALSFNLKTGDIDLAYSELSTNEEAGTAPVTAQVSLNNLVYLGLNARRGLLALPEFREALGKAINRDELVAKAYVSRARGALYPFHPDFWRLEGMDLSAPRLLAEADTLLDGLGLDRRGDDGLRLRYGQPLTLELLVNSENANRNAAATLIGEQLRQLGVQVNVVSQPFAQYQQSLQAGNYDLYIGETRLTDNMDFSPLLSGGALDFGAAYDAGLEEALASYRATGQGVVGLCELLRAQSPFVPLVFREGRVSSNLTFRTEMVATAQDIFYNIKEW